MGEELQIQANKVDSEALLEDEKCMEDPRCEREAQKREHEPP